jgi:hypothetical protein
MKYVWVKRFVVGVFVCLYLITSLISTIHVIDFFALSNPNWLAVSLAIAFEIGAAASLAAIVILDKTSRLLVWFLFILITALQISGNMFYAYTHLENYKDWIELFGLNEEEPIVQKRILSIVSGAVLPVVALGFIKSLVDYIRPNQDENFIEYEDKTDEDFIEYKNKKEIQEENEDNQDEEDLSNDKSDENEDTDGINYIEVDPDKMNNLEKSKVLNSSNRTKLNKKLPKFPR